MGHQDYTMPEVRIYDRVLNLVGSKSVHANTFDSGGQTNAYACPAESNKTTASGTPSISRNTSTSLQPGAHDSRTYIKV